MVSLLHTIFFSTIVAFHGVIERTAGCFAHITDLKLARLAIISSVPSQKNSACSTVSTSSHPNLHLRISLGTGSS
jgi:hypothetical protein